ncbi:MAG: sodium-dependent transporter [Victivallales bacterium]|jgi:NSS family neurotransmitter:Na+ symporter|nr:sodium-dependent transporter [Victivallales bacterium]
MPKITREHWSGKLGFVLAAAGSAIGLGNIWKFPYITGMNGGGAFVLVYLGCILLFGLPLMLCEITIGRKTLKNPYGAFKALQLKRSRTADLIGLFLMFGAVFLSGSGHYGFAALLFGAALLFVWLGFAAVGLLSLITAMLILSYYAVVGAWIVDYVYRAFTGGLHFTQVAEAAQVFGNYLDREPGRIAIELIIFMTLTAGMIIFGIRKGIERCSKILMPLLFILLIAVIIRGVTLPGAGAGIGFFLYPDFSKLSVGGVLEALGHAFYSLSLGMGITITYGSYLSKNENIFSTSLWIVALDTLAALLGGLAIFPAVFAMQLSPDAGPGLIFNVLPATFYRIPGQLGWLWAGAFFLMMTIAALTSAAALLESGVTFIMDQFKVRRVPAVIGTYIGITLLGFLTCYSTNHWRNLPGIDNFVQNVFNVRTGSWFDLLDKLTSNWILPLTGLFTVIFAGWIWGARKAGRELRRGSQGICDENIVELISGFHKDPHYMNSPSSGLTVITLWGILIRYVAPVIILFIFLQVIAK